MYIYIAIILQKLSILLHFICKKVYTPYILTTTLKNSSVSALIRTQLA
jgi:hypothetical protein